MILVYHKIFPFKQNEWWVEPDSFFRQMSELKNKKVVFLDDYDPENPDHVVITFDGVYQNVLEYALPILQRFSYPFECFIIGNYIGKDNSFDKGEPEARFASMNELKEIVNSGGRLQWHTNSHPNMKVLKSQLKIEEELFISKKIQSLDKSGFKWFAYPHGELNPTLIEAVKKKFSGALSCNQGNNKNRYTWNRKIIVNETSFRKSKIGVIIASYNYGQFLVEAIESVLNQTIPPDEILITDDCSEDNTYEIAKAYQHKYPDLIKINRNKKNLGIVKHFNKAVSLTKSDYICFLGADNRFRSDYLEKTAEILDSNQKIGIAYTDFAWFGPRAKVEYLNAAKERKGGIIEDHYYVITFPDFNKNSKEALKGGNFIHGSSMYKRKAFDDIGGYLEKKGRPEDHLLFLRMVLHGWNAKRVPEPLLEYRQHSTDQANIKMFSESELVFYKTRVKELEAGILEEQRINRSKEHEIFLRDNIIKEMKPEYDLFQGFKKGTIWKSLETYRKLKDQIRSKARK